MRYTLIVLIVALAGTPVEGEAQYQQRKQRPVRVTTPRREPKRTIFWTPPPRRDSVPATVASFNPPPARPHGGTTSYEAWNAAVRAMQPHVDRARATWPGVRDRYRRGLAPGEQLLVTVRLRDADARVEQAAVAVQRIEHGTIEGRIRSDIQAVSGYRAGDAYRLAESELVDWTIVRADGSEEGNVVGKFLEGYRPPPRPR
jgi:hypothetical protein